MPGRPNTPPEELKLQSEGAHDTDLHVARRELKPYWKIVHRLIET
jgi:hypothetical protein